MKRCAICGEALKSGVVCHKECIKDQETANALRWLTKETEFKFAAEILNRAADMIGGKKS